MFYSYLNGAKMTIFFTGDTHFSHAKIIKYCKRPYSSVQEMDEMLIKNWNDVVTPSDTVYHLGDFAFNNNPTKYLVRLNGQKFLIKGNHDKKPVQVCHGWQQVTDYKEIKIEGQTIILFHYAMRTWNKASHGSWSLYGHSHGTLLDDPTLLSIDVGVDSHGYHPISFEKVKALMAMKDMTTEKAKSLINTFGE